MEHRKATIADLDTAFSLIRDAITEMDRNDIPQWDTLYPTKEDLRQDIENGTLTFVFLEDQPAAIYVLSTECDDAYHACAWEEPDDTACVLHRFCVSPAFQHRGVGSAVLSMAENEAVESGFVSMRLDVFTRNPFALRLYEKAGYRQRGFADWRKGRFLLMEKRL